MNQGSADAWTGGAPSALERDRYFVEQQAALRELAKRSTLERIELDTTDLDPSSAAERFARAVAPCVANEEE